MPRQKLEGSRNVQSSLCEREFERLVGHAAATDKSLAAIVREAITFYMDHLAGVQQVELLPLDYEKVDHVPRHKWGI